MIIITLALKLYIQSYIPWQENCRILPYFLIKKGTWYTMMCIYGVILSIP